MQLKCDGKRHRLAVTATFPASIKLPGAVLSRSGCQAMRASSGGVKKTNLSHTPAPTNNLSAHVMAGSANSPPNPAFGSHWHSTKPVGAPSGRMLLSHRGVCGVTCESLGVDGDPLHSLAFLYGQQEIDFIGAVCLGPGKGRRGGTGWHAMSWVGKQRHCGTGSRWPPPALLWGAWLGQGASCSLMGCQGRGRWHLSAQGRIAPGQNGHAMLIPCIPGGPVMVPPRAQPVLTGRPWCSSANRRGNR